MKIKQVTIHAFRLFAHQVVNFRSQKFNKPANLVAVYAPNGFGKTSFFDAIEFCITGKIKRLDTNLRENCSQDHLLDRSASFIHNKSMLDDEVSVAIDFLGHQSINRSCRIEEELRLLKGPAENSYFQKTFLAQDWFSEFLLTKNSEQRFETFIQNFDETRDLLEYRRQVISVRNKLNKKTISIQRQIEETQNNLSQDLLVTNIQDIINDCEESLKSVNISIDLGSIKTVNDYEKLRLRAETLVSKNKSSLDEVNDLINKYIFIKDHDDNISSIYQLPQIEKDIKELNLHVEKLDQNLQVLEKIQQLRKTRDEKLKYIQNLQEKQEKLKYVLLHASDYNDHKEQIVLLNNKLLALKEFLNQQKLIRDKKNAEEQELLSKENTINYKLSSENSYISELSERYDKMKQILDLIKYNKNKIQELKEQQNLIEKKIQDFQNILFAQKHLYSSLQNHQLSFNDGLYIDEQKDLQIKLKNQRILEHRISTLEFKISEKKKFLSDVETLVVNAQKLLEHLDNKNKCPLCGTEFDTYDTLLSSITNNSVINSELDYAIQQKEELLKQREDLNKSVDKCFDLLLHKILLDITKEQDSLKILSKNLEETTTSEEEIQSVLNTYKEQLNTLFVDLKDKRKADIVDISEHKILEYKSLLDSIHRQLSQCISSRKQLDDDISRKSIEFSDLQQRILLLQQTELFLTFTSFLKNLQYNEINQPLWETSLESVQKEIHELKIFCSKVTIDIEHLSLRVNAIDNKIELQENYQSVNDHLIQKNEEYSSIINYMEGQLLLRIRNNQTPVSAEQIISTFESEFDKLLDKSKFLNEEKSILIKYRSTLDIILSYLHNEAVKNNLELLVSKKETVRHQQEVCNVEIRRLEKSLTMFVHDYFELDLINKLYNTVDPHPDYKNIKFDCSFNTKSPRLNVHVSNTRENHDSIVPSLYFSTAQTNVLSFSIFLAKALTAQDENGDDIDCIFIDDPIQAMDEINILSMVDLLRNVAFSMEKQIIITTHDRNFFELLQKKMPDDLFNSRFLTLEERGVFSN